MKVDLSCITKPSKLQAKIFEVFRNMKNAKKESYLIVVDSNNTPMGAIVSPQIIKAYLEKNEKESLYNSADLKDFYQLSENSFDFWNNTNDDIYQKFYKK